MADSLPTVNPPPSVATPTSTPAVVSVSSSTPDTSAEAVTVKPGMKTSEFVVTMLVIALGAVLATPGLITNSTALQIAGVALVALKSMTYVWSRTQIKTAAMLVVIVLFAHTQTACGTSQAARFSKLGYASATLQGVSVGFLAYDAQHQDQIAHDPTLTNLADVNAALAAYRAKRDKLVKSWTAAVEAEKLAYKINDDPSVATVVTAVAEAVADYTALTAHTVATGGQ